MYGPQTVGAQNLSKLDCHDTNVYIIYHNVIVHLYVYCIYYLFPYQNYQIFCKNNISTSTHFPTTTPTCSILHRIGTFQPTIEVGRIPSCFDFLPMTWCGFSGGTVSLFGGVGIRGGWLVGCCVFWEFRICFFFSDLLNSGKLGRCVLFFLLGLTH